VPPVVPKVYVLVTEALLVKPPVPVSVNQRDKYAISNTVCAAVVCDKTILPAPNVRVRGTALSQN
jgi:hypothetical protein